MSNLSNLGEGSSQERTSRVADRRAVVNVADLARQEAASDRTAKAAKTRRAPDFMPIPMNMPVPGETSAELQPDSNAPPAELGGDETATEACPPNTTVGDERSRPAAEGVGALGLGGMAAAPTVEASFTAVDDNGLFIPPDAGGAAGPAHLMAVHNGTVRIQDKVGTPVTTVSLDTFWAAVAGPGGTFDPKVLYDAEAGCWLIAACDDARLATSGVLVGVSQGPDPTGNWNLYKVRSGLGGLSSAWADYPSIGYNSKWFCVQVNVFVGSNFDRSVILLFDKLSLLSQGPGNHTVFSLTGLGGTQVPSSGESAYAVFPPGTMYLLQNWNGNGAGEGFLRLYAIIGDVGSEALIGVNFIRIPDSWDGSAFLGSNSGPQLGQQPIQLNDARMRDAVWLQPGPAGSADRLFGVHTVFLPTGAVHRSAVQLCIVRTDSSSVEQFARIDDPDGWVEASGPTWFAFPSIGVTTLGGVLIGFSQFSLTRYASAGWAFRWADDPPNTLQIGGVIRSGEGPYVKLDNQGRNRWGDYSSTSVDPDGGDGPMVWTLQEYARPPQGVGGSSGRWGTWWGKFRFSESP
jgi:hypothetical protein